MIGEAVMQVGLTDNVPVHVLGGSIVPIGAAGSSSTAAALRVPLTLLIALPRDGAGATPPQRCAPACAASQVVRSIFSKVVYKRKWNREKLTHGLIVDRAAWCQAGGQGACGAMYLDNGDELLPGRSLENYATFEALQVLTHVL